MKVIFLDFDGVVVCLPVEWDRLLSGKKVHALNRDAVARLNRIVDETDAVVVVSSTWRLHQTNERLQLYLDRAGFNGRVVDQTPDLARLADRLGVADQGEDPTRLYHPVERGHEIQAWLDAHPEVTSYVVLDDDADRGPLPAGRWVVVREGWTHGGLQPGHAATAIDILDATP